MDLKTPVNWVLVLIGSVLSSLAEGRRFEYTRPYRGSDYIDVGLSFGRTEQTRATKHLGIGESVAGWMPISNLDATTPVRLYTFKSVLLTLVQRDLEFDVLVRN